jgi:hypothetical protein
MASERASGKTMAQTNSWQNQVEDNGKSITLDQDVWKVRNHSLFWKYRSQCTQLQLVLILIPYNLHFVNITLEYRN